MKWFWILALIGMSVGCYTQKVEKAFDGDFAAADNNKIINDYCRSCHLHRDFDSAGHVEEKSLLYKRKVFRYATECRICHDLEKQFAHNDPLLFPRITRRPEEANQGKYKEFELDILENQKAKEN
jgi:hypothetical protein